jgi:tetratricopeptide (TPR) repeat protein
MAGRLCLLAVVPALCGCSGHARGPGSAEVDFLWVKSRNARGELVGGASHAVLKTEPSSSGMQVGLFESKPGGTGDLWRAATWIAALAASFAVGEDPLAHRFSVETETLSGRVDGPSAGGIFAVAIMAAYRGEKVRVDTTMTGTVNPDGAIGPAGGLPAKLAAAARIGKKRVCIPAGQTVEENELTGVKIDIAKEAVKLGLEAIPVGDLADAYFCLVGRKLELREPVRPSQMALSGRAFEQIGKEAETWLARSREAYRTSRSLARVEKFDAFWESTRAGGADATGLLKQGLVAAAYRRAVLGYAEARGLLLLTAMTEHLSLMEAGKALDVFSTVEEKSRKTLDDVFTALAGAEPAGVDSLLSLLEAYEAAITSVVSREFAKAQYGDVLRKMKEAVQARKELNELLPLFAELYPSLKEIARVETHAQRALESLSLSHEPESAGTPRAAHGGTGAALDRLDSLVQLFQGAAAANIEYFNAVFIKEVAERAQKPPEAVAAALLERELSYRQAHFNLKMPESGKMGYAASGRPASLARLAGALSSFFASSSLVTRFYSIGLKFDAGGNIAGVERAEALESALAMAERKARENAAEALRRVGTIPEAARIAYQIGLVLQEKAGYQERLEALEYFWRASVWCQVAAYLSTPARVP